MVCREWVPAHQMNQDWEGKARDAAQEGWEGKGAPDG